MAWYYNLILQEDIFNSLICSQECSKE
jgi:hypothetical protein